MNIRPATPDDAATLARLNQIVQQVHAAAEPDFFRPAGNEAEVSAFFEEQLTLTGSRILLAEVDGRAVGYLFAAVEEREQNPFTTARRMVHVHHLAVAEDYRRRGIGAALMERVRRVAREEAADRLVLSTWAFNRTAQAFFSSLGYEVFNLYVWRRP